MKKPIVTIENWAVVRTGSYLAYQELEPGNILVGRVFGHAKLSDAKSIFTSPIVSVDLDKRQVETKNTIYSLGKPSEDYRDSQEYKEWNPQLDTQEVA
jgi:hypothetical protein